MAGSIGAGAGVGADQGGIKFSLSCYVFSCAETGQYNLLNRQILNTIHGESGFNIAQELLLYLCQLDCRIENPEQGIGEILAFEPDLYCRIGGTNIFFKDILESEISNPEAEELEPSPYADFERRMNVERVNLILGHMGGYRIS